MTRKIDYDVYAHDKETEEKGKIGTATINKDGSIFITLEPFVVVPSTKALVITLLPWKTLGSVLKQAVGSEKSHEPLGTDLNE